VAREGRAEGGGVAPVGPGGGGGCQMVQTGERGGKHGPHVQNMGWPGEKGHGLDPRKQCRAAVKFDLNSNF
jgi:hypothetical protein